MVEIPQNADETRIDGLHSTEGVAFVVGKNAEDLAEIEPIYRGRGAFHRNAQGTGFYFVSTEKRSCSCPSARFKTGLIEGQCKHLRAVVRKQSIAERNAERAARVEPVMEQKANFAAAW